ncbi:ubiquitin-conjugating enzyme e2 g, putative, partial [Perkinsus marinus ATCC 50983]
MEHLPRGGKRALEHREDMELKRCFSPCDVVEAVEKRPRQQVAANQEAEERRTAKFVRSIRSSVLRTTGMPEKTILTCIVFKETVMKPERNVPANLFGVILAISELAKSDTAEENRDIVDSLSFLETTQTSLNAAFVLKVILFAVVITILYYQAGPPDSLSKGGLFSAILPFPQDYFSNSHPDMGFETPMWRMDECAYQFYIHQRLICLMTSTADERWRQILSVESISVSVISMLASPNLDSPADVDAAVEFKKDYPAYKEKVHRLVWYLDVAHVRFKTVYYMGVSEEDLDEWIELCEDKCDRLVLLASVRGQRSRPGLSDSLLAEWERLKKRVQGEGGGPEDLETVDLEMLEFFLESIHGLHQLPASDYRKLCLAFQDCYDRLVARGWSTSSISRMYSCGLELSSVLMSFIKGQLREDIVEGRVEGVESLERKPTQKGSGQTKGRYYSLTTEKIDFTGMENVDESEQYSWDLVLDAEWIGNEGRFANHADDPNASFVLRKSRDVCDDNPMAEHDSLPIQCMSLVATKAI